MKKECLCSESEVYKEQYQFLQADILRLQKKNIFLNKKLKIKDNKSSLKRKIKILIERIEFLESSEYIFEIKEQVRKELIDYLNELRKSNSIYKEHPDIINSMIEGKINEVLKT